MSVVAPDEAGNRGRTRPLALSTLGVPDADLRGVIRIALDGGCQGVELRAADGQLVETTSPGAHRSVIRSGFAGAGLAITTVASYVRVAAAGPDAPVVDALRAHVELAHDLGAAGVRVFPGGDPGDVAGSDARAASRLAAVAVDATSAGVRLLLETHDSHPRGADVARVLPGTGAGAIWDLAHPWIHGEAPTVTWSFLRPWLAEVQVKDVRSASDPYPLPPGDGALPLAEFADTLLPYQGWYCLEWEKAWHPEAAPVQDALAATGRWLARLDAR